MIELLPAKPIGNDEMPVPQRHHLAQQGFCSVFVDCVRDSKAHHKCVDNAKNRSQNCADSVEVPAEHNTRGDAEHEMRGAWPHITKSLVSQILCSR